MSTKTLSLESTFDTLNWDEKPITIEGCSLKLTRVRTDRLFKGSVSGKAATEYTFSYHPKAPTDTSEHGTVSYNGLMHFKGTINGSEEGEVVFMVKEGYYSDAARGEWVVDEESALGGLKGLKGKAKYVSTSMTDCRAWFELEL